MGEIFMKADSKKHETQKLMIIKKVAERLNNGTAKNILFRHPWTGHNATSRTFNQGKTVLMKLITKIDCEVLDICSTIDKVDATPKVIGKAGVKLCIEKSGPCYKCFHGFLKIIRLTDRKLYYLFLPFQSIEKKFIIQRTTTKTGLVNKRVTASLDGKGVR